MIRKSPLFFKYRLLYWPVPKMQLPAGNNSNYFLNQNYNPWQQANISNFYQRIK